MTQLKQRKCHTWAIYGCLTLLLIIFLGGCIPGVQDRSYNYKENLKSLYIAVDDIVNELTLTGFDGKNIAIDRLDAYATIVVSFEPQASDVDVPLSINGKMGGLRLYSRYSGEITVTFSSSAAGIASVKFRIVDPNLPSRTTAGSTRQQRQVYDAGFPVVEEIMKRLDMRFDRL